jgi:hypothetical protein
MMSEFRSGPACFFEHCKRTAWSSCHCASPISWSIAQALRAKGTELGFTYRYSLTPTRHPNGLARDLPIRF